MEGDNALLDKEKSSNGTTPVVKLETDNHYKERWMSIRITYFTMFIMSLGFSITITGIWPFLDKLDPKAGKEFMGYIVAANPIAQMIFSPPIGYWSNRIKSVRLPMLFSILIFCIASLMYSCLEILPADKVKYWMLISRFLVGAGSANVTLCRSYMSAATKINERTHAVSMVTLAQTLGFIVGPAVQAAITPLGDKGYPIFNGYLTLDMYTGAGWINFLLAVINLILFFPLIFKERVISAEEARVLQGKETQKEAWKSVKVNYVAAWTLIIAFFILLFNFVLLETIGTVLTMEQFAWTKAQAMKYMGILMSVGALVACLTFLCIGKLSQKFKEFNILIWAGFFLMAISRAVYIPLPGPIAKLSYPRDYVNGNDTMFTTVTSNITGAVTIDGEITGCPVTQEWCKTTPALTMTQFFIGYALTCIAYPIGVTLIQTIFSKVLGPRPQGVWMGLMTSSGCFSRVLGPLFVGFVYTRYGTYGTFGLTTIIMFLTMIWLWIKRKSFNESTVLPVPQSIPMEEL